MHKTLCNYLFRFCYSPFNNFLGQFVCHFCTDQKFIITTNPVSIQFTCTESMANYTTPKVLPRYIFSQGYIFYFQFYIYLYIHVHIIFCIYTSDKIEAEIQ